MSRYTFLAIPLIVTLAACGPAVSSGRFDAQPLPPTTGDVQLYSTRLPACAYDEVGLVHVRRRHGFSNLQHLVDALRERARVMGGHAVVGVALAPKVEGTVTAESTDVSTDNGLKGVVIRFKVPGCNE